MAEGTEMERLDEVEHDYEADRADEDPVGPIFTDFLSDIRSSRDFFVTPDRPMDLDDEHVEIGKFLDYLNLEDELKDRSFLRWLKDRKRFKFRWTIMGDGDTNYDVEYHNAEGEIEEFSTLNNDDFRIAIKDLREFYDEWKAEELNKILKRAGVATAIGVSLTSLITGLSLGLKRTGNDMVRDVKTKSWTRLKAPHKTPWSDLEEASGKGLVFVADHPVVVVVSAYVAYKYLKDRRK